MSIVDLAILEVIRAPYRPQLRLCCHLNGGQELPTSPTADTGLSAVALDPMSCSGLSMTEAFHLQSWIARATIFSKTARDALGLVSSRDDGVAVQDEASREVGCFVEIVVLPPRAHRLP